MQRALIPAILLGASFANAQNQFEAASVKPSGPRSVRMSRGGPGTRDPERYSYSRAVLRDLVFTAYGLQEYNEQITGPGWVDKDEFDVEARIPPGATKEQFREMLRNLLAERFKLAVHHETKVLHVYELTVAKNGPKLKESVAPGAPGGPTDPSTIQNDANGFPVLPPGRPGFVSSFGPGLQSHWTARQQTMTQLAGMLHQPNAVMDPVIDKTGLTGKYDFTLEYRMRPPAGAAGASDDAPGASLFDALEQQLGLKLAEGRAPFDLVVIDHAERTPTEN